MIARLAATAALCAAAASAATNPLSVTVNADGSYSVQAGFATFASGETGVMQNGAWLSSKTGGLTAGAPTTGTGSDAWGSYTSTAVSWSSSTGVAMHTVFRTYVDVPAIVFEQTFPDGDLTTGATEKQKDDLASSFPSFALPTSSNLGYMEYAGAFINNGSEGPNFGTFDVSSLPAKFASGTASGPTVIFDATGVNAVVISAASDFMAASTSVSSDKASLNLGILGSVSSVPQWHSHETVMWYGQGPNAAMMMWGAALLDRYGKRHDGPKGDFTNENLGYNLDHGAYYYYTTGSYANYSDVVSAVYEYSVAQGIPYKHVLLDSWWYFKGIGDGVKNWTAMPTIFTGGNAGIRAMVEQTGWKIIAHNRYWSSDNSYATQNGGNWSFYVDQKGSPAGGQMALPLEAEFWEYLLSDSVKEWGLTTYEQDWLFNEFMGVDALLTNITLGRQWLMQMGLGAQAAGVTIQYCMPFPRHIMQSIEIPAVTQVRASDDHVPCEGYYPLQWRIGFSSMFSWAVAVAPFKDNAWSTSLQPGGSCGNSLEVSPGLHLAISVFSAGPVTPGDGVGYSDAGQILRTCTVGGKLLHPSRAATSIDAQVLGKAFGIAANKNLTQNDIYSTYSFVSGWAWDHLLAADVNVSYPVGPSNLAGIRADIPIKHSTVASSPSSKFALRSAADASKIGTHASDLGTVAYTLNTSSLDLSTLMVQPFTATTPIVITPCKEVDFQVWHTAPIFANGWSLLGELNKWIPTSDGRFTSIETTDADLTVLIVGEAGEVVPLTFYNSATSNVTTISCTLGAAGTARAVMPFGVCA